MFEHPALRLVWNSVKQKISDHSSAFASYHILFSMKQGPIISVLDM